MNLLHVVSKNRDVRASMIETARLRSRHNKKGEGEVQ